MTGPELGRVARTCRAYALANLRRSLAFPTSLALEQISYLVHLAVSLALWGHVFRQLPAFAGWSFDDILVLHFFGNLFLALFHSLFMGFHTLHVAIRTGRLDVYLTRPIDPRLAHLAADLRLEELLNRLLGLVPLVLYMGSRGISLEPSRAAAGLMAMLAGLALFSLIQLTLSYLAFWLRRGDLLLSFLDLFYGFYRYPLDALPGGAQLLIALAAPVILAVTYPALFVTGRTGPFAMTASLVATLGIAMAWLALEEWLWRKGLAAYQSPAG